LALIGYNINMRVRLHRRVQKALDKINEPDFSRISKGIKYLSHEPPVGDIVAMSGDDKGYRLRVGKYRLLFDYAFEPSGKKIIIVNKLDSRSDVYKGV
jgi:mRNA interferase RelE/StbE